MLEQIREILLLHNGKKILLHQQKLLKVWVSLKMIHMLKPEH